jgi:hypothetical protein
MRWVLVPRTKTKTHRTCLLVNLTSKVLSLASSLCGLVLCGSFERQQNGFPQVFNRVFNNGMKGGVSGASYQSKPNRDKDLPGLWRFPSARLVQARAEAC